AFWIIAVVGITTIAPVTGPIELGSIAERAGLVEGLEILEVDGNATPSWHDVNLQLVRRLGETGELQNLAREGENAPRSYTLQLDSWLRGADQPDPMEALGLSTWRPVVAPLIGQLSPEGAAERAGLQAGDLILAINGEPVQDWMGQVVPRFQASGGEPMELNLERGWRSLCNTIAPTMCVYEVTML